MPVDSLEDLFFIRSVTIDRWLRGRQYWNSWAQKLLQRRIDLLLAGLWEEQTDCNNYDLIESFTDDSYHWMYDARSFFIDIRFHLHPDAQTLYCPLPDTHPVMTLSFWDAFCQILRRKSLSEKKLPSLNAHVTSLDFSNLLFPGDVSISDIRFLSSINFSVSSFFHELEFQHVHVRGDLLLNNCDFLWMLYARTLEVCGDLSLSHSRFFEMVDISAAVIGDFRVRSSLFNRSPCFPQSMEVLLDVRTGGDFDLRGAHFFNRETFLPSHIDGHIHPKGAVFTSAVYAYNKARYTSRKHGSAIFCKGIHSPQ